jgi:signal transduction histidine kinase
MNEREQMNSINNRNITEKNELVDFFLYITLVIFSILASVSLFRAIDIGWHPIMSFHVLLIAVLFFLTLFRRKIAKNVKIYSVISINCLAAIGGSLSFGMIGGNIMLWFIIPVLITTFFNVIKARFFIVFASLFLAILGTFIILNLHTLSISASEYQFAPSSWIMIIAAYAGSSIIITEVVSRSMSVTELQRQELEISDTTKNALFTVIAHDLKNPLYSLTQGLGAINSNEDEFSEDEKKLILTSLYESSKSTTSMLENLLEWATVEMSGKHMQKSECNITSVIIECVAPYKQSAENKNIDISVESDEGNTAYCDTASIKIIISNLINNAIKFTPNGGSISVKVTSKESETVIAVLDTGVGIPEDKINGLFANNEYKSSRGTNNEIGSGIGLNLCKKLIEENGGEIRVESSEWNGSIFFITLPTANS